VWQDKDAKQPTPRTRCNLQRTTIRIRIRIRSQRQILLAYEVLILVLDISPALPAIPATLEHVEVQAPPPEHEQALPTTSIRRGSHVAMHNDEALQQKSPRLPPHRVSHHALASEQLSASLSDYISVAMKAC
jgi:hypothetical protein